MARACKRCGRPCPPKKPGPGRLPRYCSDQCRKLRGGDSTPVYRCEDCGQWKRCISLSHGDVCGECRKRRKPRRKAWRKCAYCGKREYARPESECCSHKCGCLLRAKRERDARPWVEIEAGIAPCLECKSAWARHPDMFCSDACRAAREWADFCAWRRDHAKEATCKQCGAQYTRLDLRFGRLHCGLQCSRRSAREGLPPEKRRAYRQRQKARRRGAPRVETIRARLVFKRDRWTCQLCGVRVRDDYPVLHKRRAVVDHIIPLAKGGEHSYRNVQCACWPCNQKKSDSPVGQLRLA